MTDIQRNLAIGILLAIVLGGGVYFLSTGVALAPGQNNTATTTPIASSTNVTGGVQGTGDYTVELVKSKPPALGPISITSTDLSAEAKTILRQKIDAQYIILQKDPTRVDIWLKLGTNRKIGGDFSGAIVAWNYVASTAPTGMVATARGNLADLYMYFLKDYKKAQVNYTAAIAANPQVIEYYRGLFYLYKDINKDPAAAATLIEQGLKANPGNSDLLNLKSQL